MAAPTLLCKDCRYIHRVGTGPDFWPCVHPTSIWPTRQNLVTGTVSRSEPMSAFSARASLNHDQCGRPGRFFEAAPIPAEAAG